ncbi:MAG: AIR synthase-related protein [Candidatus Hodarchaeota archaeon]
MPHLKEGKVPWSLLQTITKQTGASNPGLILGPGPGIDVAVVELSEARKQAQKFYTSSQDCYLVSKADPITFPIANPAKHLIIINSNDIVTAGALPFGLSITALLPPETPASFIEELQQNLHTTCVSKNISILGGHTEVTDAISRPVLAGSMFGFVPRDYYVPRRFEIGDKIIFSGYVGAEGTGIIASEGREVLKQHFTKSELLEAEHIGSIDQLDIAKRVLDINKQFRPHAIHDVTEGGVLGAIYEFIQPSKLGASLERQKFTITSITQKMASLLNFNPFHLIGSGAVLFVVETSHANFIISTLRKHGFPADIVGEITEDPKITLDGQELDPPSADDMIIALEELKTLKKG